VVSEAGGNGSIFPRRKKLTIVTIVAEEESVGRFKHQLTLKNPYAGGGNLMNTVVILREVTGSPGRKGHLPTTRFHAVYRMVAAGLWFAFAVVVSGMFFSSKAAAQNLSWQEDPQPKRRTRAAAQTYPDQELPCDRVAMNDDTPVLTTPVPPGTVDSPSNESSTKKKTESAAEAFRGDGPQPTRGIPPLPRQPVAADEGKTVEPSEPFGNSEEGSDENDFGYDGPAFRGFLSNRLWFRGEALLWWVRGGQTPPLLTTSPGSTPQAQAGVLGQTDTTILFGDQALNTGLHAGGRLTFGLWLDRCENSGVEFSYFILGQNTQTYNNASMGNPILARPFFDVNPAVAAESSQLIAYPNFSSGTFSAVSTENFQGAEALWRQGIVHGCDGRIDLLAGYRFQRLTDGLTIADSTTSSGTASVAPTGTTINSTDLFHTRNDFNGGELGFATQWHRNRWSLETTLKLGIGQTSTQVLVNGWTTVVANGTNAAYTGGLLALPSNIGTYNSQQFSMMPEIGFTLGYDLTPRLKATAGYTLLYWSDVARPGDQIDLNVDSRQFPPPTTTTATKPEFVLHTSDFWAQGLNLGLDYRF
jgi:hypothetical protein